MQKHIILYICTKIDVKTYNENTGRICKREKKRG